MQNTMFLGILAAAASAVVALDRGSSHQAQDSSQLHRLAIGKLPSDSLSSPGSGRSWQLAASNKTSEIDAAYLYDDDVIVFGWIGCCAGLTTIVDAATGTEKLEFLDYEPHITPKGIIVFRRFYPHFSDPSIVSDSIAELDLNRPFPRKVPSKPNENPTEEIGTTIYPTAPTPGIRHEVGHNLAIIDAGKLLFLADRLSSGKLCLVRLSLTRSGGQVSKENCLTSDGFGVGDLSDIHIRQLSENAFGDLILSVDLGKPPSSIQRDFDVDKGSLDVTALKVTVAALASGL